MLDQHHIEQARADFWSTVWRLKHLKKRGGVTEMECTYGVARHGAAAGLRLEPPVQGAGLGLSRVVRRRGRLSFGGRFTDAAAGRCQAEAHGPDACELLARLPP